MKSNNQILQLCLFLFTIAHFPVTPVKCNDVTSTYTIQTAKKLSNPDATIDLASYVVASTIECSVLCSDHPLCQAFFITKSTTRPAIAEDIQFQCKLMKAIVGEEGMTDGEGTYGFVTHYVGSEKRQSFPGLKDGEFVRLEKGDNGISAFYDCYPGDTQTTGIGLVLYDDQLKATPWLNTPCSDSLCQVTGLSNTLLKITSKEELQIETTYEVQVICPEGQTHQSDVTCSGTTGEWTFSRDNFKAGCAPTTCFHVVGGYAIYGGTMSHTENNIECQRWDSQWPHIHEYGALVGDAENFCRDPDALERPWCLQMIEEERIGFCNIPRC